MGVVRFWSMIQCFKQAPSQDARKTLETIMADIAYDPMVSLIPSKLIVP
jgi:hypothetical protein